MKSIKQQFTGFADLKSHNPIAYKEVLNQSAGLGIIFGLAIAQLIFLLTL